MKNSVIIQASFVVFVLVLMIQYANAEVWIPENEFSSYFDENGIYTVIGAVKNSESYPIVPTVELRIQDGNKIISESYTLPVANPLKDIPFKIKFDQISSKNPILEKPAVTFVPGPTDYMNIEIVYDDTLVRHKDGHTSGFIVNNGNSTAYGVKVYALIHGAVSKFIDVGKSVETIEKIEPGEKKEFSIYPDPLLATQVNFYSCFVIGEDMVIPTYVMRDDTRFDFRYKTEGYLNDIKFDDEKNALTFLVRNPWPMESFVNIEFPMESDSQKFVVYQEGKEIKSIQSRDEENTWHVAFNLEPRANEQIVISGFESNKEPQNVFNGEMRPQSAFDAYYLLGIIPAAAIIALVFKARKKKPL
ncbi:MAG TPA: peptidase [Nitrosopumilaceae archaeon]|nr:peptidase [Nitrosopumilaceae archaeon]